MKFFTRAWWKSLNTDADISTENPVGNAVIWATTLLVKSGPRMAVPGDRCQVTGYVRSPEGREVARIEQKITADEYNSIDTLIGFYIKDALGCEYGWGVFFGKGAK